MRYYPLLLDLHGRACLVVGAGGVGRRKLASLLDCGPASVLVLDANPAAPDDPELAPLLAHHAVRFEARPFAPADVDGCALAFAATGNRAVNAAVADACRQRNVPCNVADAPDTGAFIVPAHFACGELTVALSTGGHSPALARRIRMDLQQWFGARYDGITLLLGRLRPLVLALGHETGQNTALFRALVESPLIDALAARDRAGAERILTELLPAELHPRIVELLHELA